MTGKWLAAPPSTPKQEIRRSGGTGAEADLVPRAMGDGW